MAAPAPDIPRPVLPEHAFGDARPFAQCHAATVVALPDGRFFVAWFAGTRESTDDVAIWCAERAAGAGADADNPAGPNADNQAGTNADDPADTNTRRGPGVGWSAPRVLAQVEPVAHWNPVLFALDDAGRDLVLHFKIGASIRRWETWTQRSEDAGTTWSEPAPLVPGDRGGRGAVRCKPIRLASGDFLAGASRERWRRWDAFFDRSPNGIDGWDATPIVAFDRRRYAGKGLIQPTLWESLPGRVHALFRSTDGHVHRADSEDDGRTWSPSRALAIPNNNSGIDVVALEDGRLVLACNPVEGNWAARTPLSLLVSHDNGETWPDRLDVETDAGEYSYPALIATPAGVALAYTWNRRRIAFAEVAATALPRRD